MFRAVFIMIALWFLAIVAVTGEREWMRYKEASEFLGISQRSLQRLVEHRQIPFSKPSLFILFERQALDNWLASRTFTPESMQASS